MATTTRVARSGSQLIDGQLYGTKWVGAVTYSDPTSGSAYRYFYDEDRDRVSVQNDSYARVSTAQMNAIHAVLSADAGTTAARAGFSVEGLTNLRLDYRAASAGADLRFANSDDPQTAYSFFPDADTSAGDVWFGQYGRKTVPGSYDYYVIMHETGHALGLKHGHETGGYGALPAANDSHEYSIMTYRSFSGASGEHYTNGAWDGPQSFMMADIAALQHMYGADYTTNSGNTVYSWMPGSGTTFVNDKAAITPGGNRVFLTVWDGGGNDTYDLSAYATAMRIDLAPGASSIFSSTQLANLGGGETAAGNVYNALQVDGDPRSLIENAIGGSGADALLGNYLGNTLRGGGGTDTLWGRRGNDSLYGGAGADKMYGEAGNDIYYVENAGDRVIEYDPGHGYDTVFSTVSFTLRANVEALKMVPGSGAVSLTGNGLGNELWATSERNVIRGLAGNDRIDSGNGADTVIGGTGADTFVYVSAIPSNPAARDTIAAGDGAAAFELPGKGFGDRFDLSQFDANTQRSGHQSFAFGTATGIGRLWAVDSGGHTLLRGNTDSDAAAEFEVLIADGAGVRASAYTAQDFIL